MNPSRGLAAALLAAALAGPAPAASNAPAGDQAVPGRCAGAGPAPRAVLTGPPFVWSGAPATPAALALWTGLGYRYDPGTGHLIGAGGRALPAAEYRRLMSPFDASTERLDPLTWSALMGRGYRVDEATCRILAPGSRRPLLRAQILLSRRGGEVGALRHTMGDLLTILRRTPAGEPVPPAVLRSLQLARSAGVRIPAALRASLAGAANAGDAAASLEAAYADSTRLFDFSRGLKAVAESSLPVLPGGVNAPARPPVYQDSLETRLGRAFDADLAAQFARTPSGRRMLARFRDARGAARLPDIVMVKMSQRPFEGGYGQSAAVANPETGGIQINHWDAARVALETAPAKDRAALAKEFSDPAKLALYLLNHPDARKAFISREDVVLYHELTHIWQFRRDASTIEQVRGNAPGLNPLEREHEAYREQFRYLTDKLALEPRQSLDTGWVDMYQMLLAQGYPALRTWIDGRYMGTFAGSSDFKTVEQVQAQRESVARRLRKTSAYAWVLEGLKLVGLRRADAALRADDSAYRSRARDFETRILPEMRRQGYPRLIAAYEGAGRPGQALSAMLEIPPDARAAAGVTPKTVAAERDAVARGLASSPKGWMDLPRYQAWQALEKCAQDTGTALPPALAAQEGREFAAAARNNMSAAAQARDPRQRADDLTWAEAFAAHAPPDRRAALLRRIAALEKTP